MFLRIDFRNDVQQIDPRGLIRIASSCKVRFLEDGKKKREIY